MNYYQMSDLLSDRISYFVSYPIGIGCHFRHCVGCHVLIQILCLMLSWMSRETMLSDMLDVLTSLRLDVISYFKSDIMSENKPRENVMWDVN